MGYVPPPGYGAPPPMAPVPPGGAPNGAPPAAPAAPAKAPASPYFGKATARATNDVAAVLARVPVLPSLAGPSVDALLSGARDGGATAAKKAAEALAKSAEPAPWASAELRAAFPPEELERTAAAARARLGLGVEVAAPLLARAKACFN